MEAAATIDNRDEEEVAETLYALAGMFPHNASNHNSTILDGKSLPANSSVLQDLEDNSSDALEGIFYDRQAYSYSIGVGLFGFIEVVENSFKGVDLVLLLFEGCFCDWVH
ncbi:hypothetical protein HKD37_06G017122 [Glycine soja]